MEGVKRICQACRGGSVELQFYRTIMLGESILLELPALVDLYVCPWCGRVEMFAHTQGKTPLEEMPEFRNDVERFEYHFRDYSDKQLQKVIDGKDYVPDAKKAARNLLYRRKYGQEDTP